MAYKSIEEIFEHNEQWIKRKLAADPEYFVKLSKRQKPRYLFIGCSDSRISTEAVMFAKPGDVFIHRNIANVVANNDLNMLSVIKANSFLRCYYYLYGYGTKGKTSRIKCII